jgi:hypothetical protein
VALSAPVNGSCATAAPGQRPGGSAAAPTASASANA